MSVTDQTDEARYPAFQSIMAAKKKPIETLTLADIGVDAAAVGLAAASVRTVAVSPAPPGRPAPSSPTTATGAGALAQFLAGRGSI